MTHRDWSEDLDRRAAEDMRKYKEKLSRRKIHLVKSKPPAKEFRKTLVPRKERA